MAITEISSSIQTTTSHSQAKFSRVSTHVFIAISAMGASIGILALIHLKGGHSMGFLNPLFGRMKILGAWMTLGVGVTAGTTLIFIQSKPHLKIACFNNGKGERNTTTTAQTHHSTSKQSNITFFNVRTRFDEMLKGTFELIAPLCYLQKGEETLINIHELAYCKVLIRHEDNQFNVYFDVKDHDYNTQASYFKNFDEMPIGKSILEKIQKLKLEEYQGEVVDKTFMDNDVILIYEGMTLECIPLSRKHTRTSSYSLHVKCIHKNDFTGAI